MMSSSSNKGGNFGAAGRAPSCKDKVRIRAWLEPYITCAEPLSYSTDRKLKATNKEVQWLDNSYCAQVGGLSGYNKASEGLIKPL